MNLRVVAYCLIAIELAIQVFGLIYSDQTPQVVYALADTILILVPLVFGIRLGLICLTPFAASEIYWSCNLKNQKISDAAKGTMHTRPSLMPNTNGTRMRIAFANAQATSGIWSLYSPPNT